jgi:hypothetical protein
MIPPTQEIRTVKFIEKVEWWLPEARGGVNGELLFNR